MLIIVSESIRLVVAMRPLKFLPGWQSSNSSAQSNMTGHQSDQGIKNHKISWSIPKMMLHLQRFLSEVR
jgi:hypothetical protein